MGLRLFVSYTTGWIRLGTCKSFYHSPHISLTRCQRDQSLIAVAGDSDNSLSMRSVKLGSSGSMIHAAGAGGGRQSTARGWVRGAE